MATKGDVKVQVTMDMNLLMGKILNKNNFYRAFADTVKQLQIPTEALDAKLLDKPNKAKITKFANQVIRLNTAIAKRLADSSAEIDKRLGPAEFLKTASGETEAKFKSRLKTMQKSVGAIGRVQSTVTDASFEKFQGKKFKKIFDAAQRGQNVGKIFGPKGAAQLKEYIALVDQVIGRIQKYQTTLAASSGVTKDAFITGKGDKAKEVPATGEARSVITPKLGAFIQTLKAQREELKKATPEGFAADLNKRNAASIKNSLANLKLLTKARAQADKLAESREEIAGARAGRKVRLSGVAIGGLEETKLLDLQKSLTRSLGKYAAKRKRIFKKVPKSDARETVIGRLDARAKSFNLKLDEARLKLKKLKAQSAAGGKTDSGSNIGMVRVGDQIIQREGSIQRAAGVPVNELEFVRAAIKKTRTQSRAELDKLTKSGVDSGEKFTNLKNRISDADLALSRISKRLSGFGSILQQTGALFRQFFRYALGYGILYQALASIRALIGGVVDLDKSLKSIQAVTGATLESMSEIEVGIKKVALSTKFGTQEIAQAAKVLAQAGVKPEDFTGVLDSVATFASATESSIENAADLVSTMRNVFVELNDQTIANQLTKAINISKLTAEDLKTILSRGAQVARGFNLTSDQFLAAVTVLRNAGIKASTVATGLRQGLIELLSPDKKTIDVLYKRYAELGEKISEATIRARFFGFAQDDNPLISVLGEFKRLGFTGAAKGDFQRVFDVRASNAITALIDNMEQLQSASTKLTFGSSALKASQTQMESMANSMSNLGAAVTVLADQMGSGLVDSLEDVADMATEVVKKLAEMDAQFKALGGPGIGSAVTTGALGGAAASLLPGSKGFISKAGRFAVGTALGTKAGLVAQEQTTEAGAGEGTIRAVSDVAGLLGSLGLVALWGWIKSIFTTVEDVSKGAESSSKTIKKLASKFTVLSIFISSIAKWFKKAPILGAAITLMRAHPIGAGISAIIAFVGLWSKFVNRDKVEDAKARLLQSTKNFDKAVADRDKQLELFDEYRLGGFSRDATPGTTAASIDELETDLSDINSQINTVFGVVGDDAAKVKAILVRINKEAAEASTPERAALLEELGSIVKLDLTKGKVDSKKISDMAALAAKTVDAAGALQESVADAVTQIVQIEGDAELVQKALLHSFRKIAKESEGAYYQMIGLAEATPERVAELNRLLLLGMQEFLDASDAAIKEEEKVTEAAGQQVDALVAAIANADSKEKVSELMLTLRQHLIKVGDTVENYLARIVSKLVVNLPEEDREYATGLPQNTYDKVMHKFGRFTPKGGVPESPEASAQRGLERTYSRRQDALAAKAKLQPAFDIVTRKKEELSSSEFAPVKKWYDTVTREMGELDKTITEMTVALEGSRQVMDYLRFDQQKTHKQQVEMQRRLTSDVKAAREVMRGAGFEEFMSTMTPKQRVGIEALKQPNADLLIDATAVGGKKGQKVAQPDTTRGLKQVEDYRQSVLKEQMGKIFKPTKELSDAKAFLERQLAKSVRENLADADRTRRALQFIEEQLKEEEIAFYEARAAIVGAKDDPIKKALKKADELKLKQEEIGIKTLASQRDDSNTLFDRERALRDEKSIIEEIILTDLKKREKEARRTKDPILGEFSADNPLVMASSVARDQLNRQLETQEKIVDRTEKSEKEHIDAKAEVQKLLLAIYNEEAELESKILDERKKLADFHFSQTIKVLKDQLKTIERSLDFATERGYQEQVSSLMEKRVEVYKALRAVELAQLKHQGASLLDQRIFAASTEFNARQLKDLFVKAQNTIKATTERFDLLEPQPSELGDFKETGRKKAIGVPLSEKAQTAILRARIDVQSGQLESIAKNLTELEEKNEKNLGLTPATRATFKSGRIVYPSGTSEVDQEEIDKALKAEQALVREANDLVAGIAESRQGLEELQGGVGEALATGFNLSDLADRLDDSQSAIKNLGRTIQEELTKGFEDAGDAAAAALIDGENFTTGLRQAFSDMFKQVARDMIKSGFLKMMSMLVGGAGGVAATSFASFFSGKQEQKASGGMIGEGGVIKGKGTGTSDSIMGTVTNSEGKITRGVHVSDGEGIIRSSSMDILGKGFLDMMNTQPKLIAKALSMASAAPLRRATGGMIGDIRKTFNTTNLSKAGNKSVDYQFSANINIGKDEDSSIPVEVMQQMDKELTQKIGEYVQSQMKPGGLLSAAR